MEEDINATKIWTNPNLTDQDPETVKEILAYLKERPWHDLFMANFEKDRKRFGTKKDLAGHIADAAELTVRGAFVWDDTPEGTKFWSDANDAFCEWYVENVI